jgi:hypothetical protein
VFQAAPPGWGAQETKAWDRGHSAEDEQRSVGGRLHVFWDYVLWDKKQRFGPVIFLLALAGLLGRRRSAADLILFAVLMVQLVVWLFATHLFARFAVVLLIPLALLCGCAIIVSGSRRRRQVIVGALVVGGAWNFWFAVRLHGQESPGGAPASLIYEGKLEKYKYFQVINHELPPDAKILLVGEARAFYFQRDVEYCVVFNRNPFFEVVRASKTPHQVLHWLREKGCTHVLVNWSEVRRLADSYGFSSAVDARLLDKMFAQLETAGLSRLHGFPHPQTGGRYVDLYAVPR